LIVTTQNTEMNTQGGPGTEPARTPTSNGDGAQSRGDGEQSRESQLAQSRGGGDQSRESQLAQSRGGGDQSRESQLARRNPFALLDELQDELAHWWSRPFGAPMIRPARLLAQLPLGTPRLDVYEENGSLVVKAEVPGVKKEDMRVTLEDGDLVIQGETRAENEVKQDQYYRMERRVGRFYRRIPLPFEVKPEDVQANMSEGVLEVRIPKPTAEAKSTGQQIPVK
jgi:HSP20 family protein